MEISGNTFIPASREEVWKGLNDIDILGAAIPGCKSISKSSDTDFDVLASVSVGPVKANFKAKLNISDANPPSSYVLDFNSQGGVAGVARGHAKVMLEPEGEGTRLSYLSDVQLSGKLAQIGARLINSTTVRWASSLVTRAATSGGSPGRRRPVSK